MNWVILFFCLGFGVLAYKRPDWAVLFLIFALPAYLIRFNLGMVPFTLLEAMIWIAFLVWIVKKRKQIKDNLVNTFKGKSGTISYPLSKEIVFLLLVSLLSVAVAGFSDSALGVWKAYFLEPLLVFILILNNFQLKKDYQKIIYGLAFSSFLLAIYAWVQKFTGWGIGNEFWQAEVTRRATSVFPYPNALALFLAPLLIVFWGQICVEFKKRKDDLKKFLSKVFFLFLTIILGLGAIYFARSEGALIALAVSGLIFFWFQGGRFRGLVYGAVAAALLFLIFFPAPRLWVTQKATLNDLSGEIRKQQWRETWEMLSQDKKTFFLGAGLATYQKKVAPYHQEGIFYNRDKDPLFRTKLLLFDQEYKSEYWQPVEIYLYPHNIFLNFWTELGLAGVLLFAWIIIKLLAVSRRNIENGDAEDKYLSLGLGGALVVILVHGLVDVPYFKNDLAVAFWVLAGLISMISLKIKYKPDKKN